MNAQGDQPNSSVKVHQGESVSFMTIGNSRQEIGCSDIARLALAMHDKSYYFLFRRGLTISFHRDINGGGTQLLQITGENGKDSPLIRAFFYPTRGDDESFLYEADLITDQRKDYEPTVNRGKHRFVATEVELRIDPGSEEVQQWRHDVERLSKKPDTLAEWVQADLEAFVRCSAEFRCARKTILTNSDLARHAAANVSLEDLKARLTCSKCGKRQPYFFVF